MSFLNVLLSGPVSAAVVDVGVLSERYHHRVC